MARDGAFDLVLAYPQWQGSGRHENLPRGAAAAASVCARFGPVEHVPLSVSADAGEARRHGVRRWDDILAQFAAAQRMLTERRPRSVLTAGGDCAVDIAAIDYLNSIHTALTVIWVDAHLDANTPETTPSGSFHGMPVSAIMGHAPDPMRALLRAPLDPARFRYFGASLGDEGDHAFRAAYHLGTLAADETFDGPVHIHFDLDVLDPAEFPHVAYPEGTLSTKDALALVRRIAADADIVGFTVTEFAPADEIAVREGSALIARLCEAAASNGKDRL